MGEFFSARLSVDKGVMKKANDSVLVTNANIETKREELSEVNDLLINELGGELKTCFKSVAENIEKGVRIVNHKLKKYSETHDNYTNTMSWINLDADKLTGGNQNG